MSTTPIESLPTAERRRLVTIGLLRALATTVVVVAAYYLLPLNNLAGISLAVALAVGLLALTAVVAYQVRAIIRHPHSAVRAIEALAVTVPVFLVLFAATYFMMEQSNTGNFNVDSLTRTDSLYFTVTVFATVGFGDITATSQVARVVVRRCSSTSSSSASWSRCSSAPSRSAADCRRRGKTPNRRDQRAAATWALRPRSAVEPLRGRLPL